MFGNPISGSVSVVIAPSSWAAETITVTPPDGYTLIGAIPQSFNDVVCGVSAYVCEYGVTVQAYNRHTNNRYMSNAGFIPIYKKD